MKDKFSSHPPIMIPVILIKELSMLLMFKTFTFLHEAIFYFSVVICDDTHWFLNVPFEALDWLHRCRHVGRLGSGALYFDQRGV